MRVLFLAGLAGGLEMIKTPYYLIDKTKLLRNMEKIAYVREQSGAKALLALKCFATWSVFDLMQQYMDGTTSSSLYELKLGRQKFEGEAHAYSVAWADDEIEEMLENCDKIIFNSISQLQRFADASAGKVRGLRVNPQVSSSDYLLADPARPFSRLGEWDPVKIEGVIEQISGFMFHNNCENGDFARFDALLGEVERRYGEILQRLGFRSQVVSNGREVLEALAAEDYDLVAVGADLSPGMLLAGYRQGLFAMPEGMVGSPMAAMVSLFRSMVFRMKLLSSGVRSCVARLTVTLGVAVALYLAPVAVFRHSSTRVMSIGSYITVNSRPVLRSAHASSRRPSAAYTS